MTMTKEAKKWIVILSCVLAAVILFGVLARVPVNNAGAAGSTYVCPHSVVDWATDGTEDVELVKEDGKKVRLVTYECSTCHEKISIEQPIDAVLDNIPAVSGSAPAFVGNWSFGFTNKDTLAFTPYNSFYGNWMCYDGQPWAYGNGAVNAITGVIGMDDTCTSYVSFCYTAPKDGVISWYVADYNVIDSETAFPEAIIVMSGERVVEFSTPIKSDKDYFYEYFNNIQREVKAGDQVVFCFGTNIPDTLDGNDGLWVDVAVSYMSDLPFKVNEYDAQKFNKCSHASYYWTSDGSDYEIIEGEDGNKFRVATYVCDFCPYRVKVRHGCDMVYDHLPTASDSGELVNGSGNWSFGFVDRNTLDFTAYNTAVNGCATYNGEESYEEHGGIALDTGCIIIQPPYDPLVAYSYTAEKDGVLTWHAADYDYDESASAEVGGTYPSLVVVYDGERLVNVCPITDNYNFWATFNNMQLSVEKGMRVLFCFERFFDGVPVSTLYNTRVNVSVSYMPDALNVREYNSRDFIGYN